MYVYVMNKEKRVNPLSMRFNLIPTYKNIYLFCTFQMDE